MKSLSPQCIEKLEIIGSGSFGKVFKCRDLRNGEFVAVKEIDLDANFGGGVVDDCFDELRAEISTLMTCEHENIIRYRGSYVTNSENSSLSTNNNNKNETVSSPLSNKLCIVMDYCERGSLRQVLDQNGSLNENYIAEIAESILKALEYLHKQGIGHRDLKGANVLVDASGRVKLGDFGVAFQPEDSQDDNKLVGSPYWMAPEVLNFKANDLYDASKADIWSFGITLIELLKSRPPLHYLSPRAAMAAIPRTSPPRLESDDPSASKRLKDLIHACLHDDPRRRPSASQLLKSFKSYFKQQKSTTTSSLSTATHHQKTNSSTSTQVPSSASNRKKVISETIYSQWDFDLSTLTSEASDVVIEEKEIKKLERSGPVNVNNESSSNTIVMADEPTSPRDNLDPSLILKFRKLELKKRSSLESILWENKDNAVLPIPCPSDAPDLSKPLLHS